MTLSDFILAFKALEKETLGKCFYCGIQTQKGGLKPSNAIFQTKDHVIPASAKGGDRRANRVVCCRSCNKIKEDLTLQEFKRRTGAMLFYSETLLNVRIADLEDIETIDAHILNTRKVDGRSIKFHGKKEPRTRPPVTVEQA
jgi:HNH endonuclease